MKPKKQIIKLGPGEKEINIFQMNLTKIATFDELLEVLNIGN